MSMLQKIKNVNIDPKECGRLWIELGSLDKVSIHLANRGIVNEKSGKPYTRDAISRCFWNWAVKHPEESYQFIKDCGGKYSETIWRQQLVLKAYSMYVCHNLSRENFEAWLEENDLSEYKNYRSNRRFFNSETVQE
jgi:hypothetical protein